MIRGIIDCKNIDKVVRKQNLNLTYTICIGKHKASIKTLYENAMKVFSLSAQPCHRNTYVKFFSCFNQGKMPVIQLINVTMLLFYFYNLCYKSLLFEHLEWFQSYK